ncbi:MAG: glycoside hydrolase family 113, partial [Deltaproteobacteria bacterium]
LYAAGIRHIVLSPVAHMTDPRKSEITPDTPPSDRPNERKRYIRLINYIHGKGMTVGIRPIFLVVDSNGNAPLIEKLPNGKEKLWWHGNIQPDSPNAWFESFKTYLDLYLPIAQFGKVEQFTIGAELYSMTVGIEDQWEQNPHGFPGRWLSLLKYVKSKLPQNTQVMYDINFTDDKVSGSAGGLGEFGGEFARWRYRLVDLANPTRPEERVIWQDLVDFWKQLDAIGIDMYRSLATSGTQIPSSQQNLTVLLKETSDRFATQIDNALFEIENIVGSQKNIILKEVGYRSVENCFIDPFLYVTSERGQVNLNHQAAAFDAVFQSFWKPNWPWFGGIVIWDASINPQLHGPQDSGFSFLGKQPTQEILNQYFAH